MSGINSVGDRADINSVLAQMRAMKAQLRQPERVGNEISPSQVNKITPTTTQPSFGALFGQAINSVNETQQQASALATAYEKGDPNVDLTRVMIQSQKASVSFQALTQVRNKVVQAYEDIMKMPV
ncbi:MAG: flagellar hook-basal body complex protein FliE [Hahellaceae bacterium]|nr:flagellar hook-basal body complex protein FliE [Hahellaceae bacterium]